MPLWWRCRLERSPCKLYNWIKQRQTRSWKIHFQTLGNRCKCHGSSKMTIINGCPLSYMYFFCSGFISLRINRATIKMCVYSPPFHIQHLSHSIFQINWIGGNCRYVRKFWRDMKGCNRYIHVYKMSLWLNSLDLPIMQKFGPISPDGTNTYF